MTGLELSRAFFEECGLPMLEAEFGDELPRIAAGLAGRGSECFGFDDEISRDHDFAPGFCLWITEEDDRAFGFSLFRAYRRLPEEFRGVRLRARSRGGEERGVQTIADFYRFYTGTGRAPETLREWLAIPEFYLAEATNGAVFRDPLGEFSAVRAALLAQPEDVRKKKLASELFYMAQTGQYNYARCLDHGERAAAAATLADFARHTARALHALAGRYAPYYKWLFRSAAGLPECAPLAARMEAMLERPLDRADALAHVDALCAAVADRVRAQGLCARTGEDLEPYAYAVRQTIRDGDLRTLPVML